LGEMVSAYKLLIGKPEGNKSLGRPRFRWGKTLKWFLEKYGDKLWTRIWLRIGTSGGTL